MGSVVCERSWRGALCCEGPAVPVLTHGRGAHAGRLLSLMQCQYQAALPLNRTRRRSSRSSPIRHGRRVGELRFRRPGHRRAGALIARRAARHRQTVRETCPKFPLRFLLEKGASTYRRPRHLRDKVLARDAASGAVPELEPFARGLAAFISRSTRDDRARLVACASSPRACPLAFLERPGSDHRRRHQWPGSTCAYLSDLSSPDTAWAAILAALFPTTNACAPGEIGRCGHRIVLGARGIGGGSPAHYFEFARSLPGPFSPIRNSMSWCSEVGLGGTGRGQRVDPIGAGGEHRSGPPTSRRRPRGYRL